MVILHAEADNSRTIVMHERLGEFEDQRVPGIKGNIHFTAQNEILLCIVLRDPVKSGSATKGIARIERSPNAVGERIAEMSFDGR